MQQPTVGRIVHYQSYGTPGNEHFSVARAAIVTEVYGEGITTVGLCILNPTGMFFTQSVEFSEVPTPGRWSWPPRT